MTMRMRSNVPQIAPFVQAAVRREPAGEVVPYRGYLLAPMRETFGEDPATGRVRSRWDVLEQIRIEGQPTLINRVKTCASRVTAEGWVDSFGEPVDEPGTDPADEPVSPAAEA